jgi:gliding motility-associated-like protein
MVYHKPTVKDEYLLVAEGDMTEREFLDLAQVSGCYAVQAIDTNGNKGSLSAAFCIDNCPVFELPNVFTPNGDGVNDTFKAIRVRQIKKISLKILDRWGNLVYETTDPYFQWNGVSAISKVPNNESTYYYICDVYEPRLAGEVIRPLKGTIHLAR